MSEMNEIKSTKTQEQIKQSNLKPVTLFASRIRLMNALGVPLNKTLYTKQDIINVQFFIPSVFKLLANDCLRRPNYSDPLNYIMAAYDVGFIFSLRSLLVMNLLTK